MASPRLTVVLPTRNRPVYYAAQLRFLAENQVIHPILVADASGVADAEYVERECAGIAAYRHFDPSVRLVDKLAQIIGDVTTPYIVLAPDDDIVLPHALDAAVAHLENHPNCVVAHGYYLDFALHSGDFDIYAVFGFTPPISEDEPLRRHYELMRRYQSFYWGVFRTEVFDLALERARAIENILFRELTIMSVSVLQGKVARLPVIYGLRGAEQSLTPLHESHPLFALLHDTKSFFENYIAYREGLAQFINAQRIEAPKHAALPQLLDVIHACWLGREIDFGQINYRAQTLLGDLLPPIQGLPNGLERQEIADGDVIHLSERCKRRYIWRKNVIEAEPRNEITISAKEIAGVEQQLDAYRLNAG
jgi:glycosyltransferase domain-containing protein